MATTHLKKELAVVADIEFGMGTVDQSRGTQEQINGSKIPYDASKTINDELDLKETVTANDAKLATKADLHGNVLEIFQALQGTADNDVVTLAKLVAELLLKTDVTYVDGQLALKADETNTMLLDGSTPSPDYVAGVREIPANKGYVLDTVVSIGTGDMAKAVYDTNDSGVVDTTEGIGIAADSMGISAYNQIMRLSQGTLLDCNLVEDFGIFVGINPLNAPTAGAIGIEQLEISGNKAQRAFSFTTYNWYDRVYLDASDTWSAWSEWAKMSDVNLKADITYVDTFLPLAGGTITDDLAINTAVGVEAEIRLEDNGLRVGRFLKFGDGTVGIQTFASVGGALETQVGFDTNGNISVNGVAPISGNHLTRKDYVDQAILALNPIGSVVMRMDAIDPATIYGGTWSLVTGAASLTFGDGSVRDGAIVGSDTQTVTLPEHSHANTAASTFAGSAMANHTHNNPAHAGQTTQGGPYTVTMSGGPTTYPSQAVSAGTPAGSVTTTMTNVNAGTAGATMDVAGARIAINVWQRTA